MLLLPAAPTPEAAGRSPCRRALARVAATALCCIAILHVGLSGAQGKPAEPGTSAMLEKPVRTAMSRPLWKELSPSQQQALSPLATHWDRLNGAHKRKWLALSRNHSKLSPAEQAKLHSRMSDWAGLSQQERAQARFNFDEVKQIPSDERKAKWEAYQALSEKERRFVLERERATHGILISQSDSGIRTLACRNWKRVKKYVLQPSSSILE